jgi:hypothetical protein
MKGVMDLPQGAPSTTFLETLNCRVQLIGYDTEGLRGIIQSAGAGWLTPRGNPGARAARVASLDGNRVALSGAAQISYEFARTLTFEETMRVRVEYLQNCATRTRVNGR